MILVGFCGLTQSQRVIQSLLLVISAQMFESKAELICTAAETSTLTD